MIERFHRSLKSSLRARAADSDWVSHLPLVLLGLRSVPKEDTGFSVSEAVYGSPLTIPGEFLEAPEIPSLQFISKVEKVIAGFSTPPPHHVQYSPPVEVPAALRTAKFVFVREDASKPSLSPLYRGPYLVIQRLSKFFRLQIGTKVDSVSLDRLKPVLSDSPVIPVAPPPQGRPPLRQLKDPPGPSSAAKSSASKKRSVMFLTQPVVPLTDKSGKKPLLRRDSAMHSWGEYCGGRRSNMKSLKPDILTRQEGYKNLPHHLR